MAVAPRAGSGVKLTPGLEELKEPGWPENTILNSEAFITGMKNYSQRAISGSK